VAIAVADDAQWQRLCSHAQLLDLLADGALAALPGRQQAQARIEAQLAAWTRQRAAADIETALQQLGIAAHRLADTHTLSADPQLRSRGFVRVIAHPQFGHTAIESSRFLFSRTPAAVPEVAVSYGSHAATVLRELLHYSGARVEQLEAEGVLK
jgi:crotonobetainyl-CoA:carnitine CoA-transferase CaiB-like acyl-CoA transferase